MAKNPCGKMRPADNPYEVWVLGDWTWKVLKKHQVDNKKPFARWHCLVITPMCPQGEYGDVYVKDIVDSATRVE